jgi:hypothetical protein
LIILPIFGGWYGVEDLLIMQFSPASCHFIPFKPENIEGASNSASHNFYTSVLRGNSAVDIDTGLRVSPF